MSRNMRPVRRPIGHLIVRDRVYRNMRAVQSYSKKETFLRGIGAGLVFLAIGGVILALNVQAVWSSSIMTVLQRLPAWVWVIGGGTASFGLYWTLKNAWQLIGLLRAGKPMSSGQDALPE